jgi:hypothetical protein
MRFLSLAAAIIIATSLAAAAIAKRDANRKASEMLLAKSTPEGSAAAVPVIVELFTSEGCSSCPPADALLVSLENEQPVGGAEIVALEEHVDYWNDLGWMDPFSSSALTARQQRYAEAFAHGSSYTPQMVVDGRFEFVGSRSAEARKSIAASALQTKAEVKISRTAQEPNAQERWSVIVDKLASASAEPAEVWLAVTETHLHSNVERGENAGRDLPHAAVVRQLTKIASLDGRKQQTFSATPPISFPGSWKKENLRVVVFVQEKNSRHIVGAASVRVAP